MGAVSGVVVLDADGHEGIAAARQLLGEDALTVLQSATGGGGRHYFFRHPGNDRRVGNSTGKLAPRIDVRGDGGYVILPPSTTTGAYRWANPEGEVKPWRWGTTDARDIPEAIAIEGLPEVAVESDTAVAERERAVEAVRTAAEGTLNNTLNDRAYRLGHIAAAGGLDPQRTAKALSEAAEANGHPGPGARRTVASGLSSGAGTAMAAIDPASLDVAQLLDRVVAFLRRFVVLAHVCQAYALALWAVHTHCAMAAACTPYIWVSSPAPTSGKTRLAEVLELLVRSPIRASDASPSSIFRSIPLFQPTLLLDEIDTKFRAKGDDGAEDLRRLINSGFNRGAYVLRTEGRDRVPTKFDTYCPKMLIGINTGVFPDTVAKRSIPIRIHRKTRAEKTERFRVRKVGAEADELQRALAAWAEAHTKDLTLAEPDLPDELNDRQQDAWEPLLAIADSAGSEWASRAREAARYLHGALEEETTEGVLLLGHIRDAFDTLKTDKLLTGVLLTALIQKEEGPWTVWWERAVNDDRILGPSSKLARMLRVFDIEPKSVRTDGGRGQGYERSGFEKAWSRYLDTPPSTHDNHDTAGSATRDVMDVMASEGGIEQGDTR